MTIAFQVDDMTCGHCVSTIPKAVKAADRHARVEVDLQRHLVQIEPFDANAEALGAAIRQASYTPASTRSTGPLLSPGQKSGGGGSCS